MEETQESSPSKPSTKSSRKRLRKRQAAALEKFILASEAAGSCKIEPTQESVEIRGCLSNIVFHNNSLGEKEFFVSKNTPQDTVNTKTKSVCCEGTENVSLEKNLNQKQESVVPHSKRKRNGKKNFASGVNSNNSSGTILSNSQKSVDTQTTQHRRESQIDCPKQEKSLLSSLNHTVSQAPVVATSKDSKIDEAAEKVDNKTSFKQQEETGDKVSTLSRSKRRRNRKKAIVLSECSDAHGHRVNDKGIKSQEITECSSQLATEHLLSQKSCISGQRLNTANSSTLPASVTNVHPLKNISVFKCVETDAEKLGKDKYKKECSPQVSILSEKSSDTGKKNCEPNLKSASEKKKGVNVTEAEMHKGPSPLEKEKTVTVDPESTGVQLKHLEVVKSEGCESVFQKEQSYTSLVFQKTGECSTNILGMSTGSHPTPMEGTQNNILQVGKVPGESSNTEEGKSKDIYVSKCAFSKKVAHVHSGEVYRSSDAMDSIRNVVWSQSGVESTSNSKHGDIMKEIPEINRIMLSKGAPLNRKVVPIPSEVVEKSVACTGSVSIEEKSEPSKKDDSEVTSSDSADKLKEKVKAEREARKAAKLLKRQKHKTPGESEEAAETRATPSPTPIILDSVDNKVVESIEGKPKRMPTQVSQESEKTSMEKSKAELRAERRAKQESQRAAKASATSSKTAPTQVKVKSVEKSVSKAVPREGSKMELKQPSSYQRVLKKEQGVKLISRLGWGDGRVKRISIENMTLEDTRAIHPAIVQLSSRFTNRTVSGSNARCMAFVQAIIMAILDYRTPPQKELGRDLDARLLTPSLAYLESQRPHAISVLNAKKFLKWQLTQLQPCEDCPSENSSVQHAEMKKSAVISDEEAKQRLINGLQTYLREKIKTAEQAICATLREKIKDGDVIMTYGCSYLLQQILIGAKESGTKFKVVVVDGRPWKEGREMLRCLVAVGIPCSYVLLSAASTVMRQVNKVLLGAHALLSNGHVMSRVGVTQVALLANAHNVPVLVACETHKFCERVQSDPFVYNEMGDADCLAQHLDGEDGPLSDWRSIPSLTLLNLSYDVTPPELVTAVATELAVLPCTSVPVVLRVQPADPIAQGTGPY